MKQLNPHISVDCVIFGFHEGVLKVLLIKQQKHLLSSKLKLPGDLVFEDESLDNAALRVLKDLTDSKELYLRQFFVFGSPGRISGNRDDLQWLQETSKLNINRVVTIAYYSLVNLDEKKEAFTHSQF